MRPIGVLVAAAAALAVLVAPSASAADECRGLMVCIPVAGPWVVIPAASLGDRYPARSWHMRCPQGSIVGGVDARLSSRAVDISFTGLLGSPVNPGITTTDEVVFTGTFTGGARRPAAFRPFIGCIPTAGGGRIPTSVRVPAAVKPGTPTRLRVRTVSFSRALVGVTHACSRGERLISYAHAVALRSGREPTRVQLAGVRSRLSRQGPKLVASATVRGREPRARLQIQAVCTRGPDRP